MGIQKEFNYQINLYSYSFAFSSIKPISDINNTIKVDRTDPNHNFLSQISKEIFNIKNAVNTKSRKILNSCAFVCM